MSVSIPGKLTFAYPGNLDLKTGGYGYDRRILAELERQGWDIERVSLGEGFPAPSLLTKQAAEANLSALPDDTLVVIDGLAFGVLDDWAHQETDRLKIVALVHHPLALETGLTSNQRDRLLKSERKALCACRHVIVTSPNTQKELIAHYGVGEGKITIALPGTNPAPGAVGDGVTPHIVSIGTMIPRKGHDILIAALKMIDDLVWRATLVGSKTLSPQTAKALEEQIQTSGLGNKIALVGEVDDTSEILAKADIFALASRYEGYGMVFAEALSHGLPIVACKAGAVPDVIPADAGYLVPVDDAQALAESLRTLLERPTIRKQMASAAKEASKNLPKWAESAQIISTRLEALQ